MTTRILTVTLALSTSLACSAVNSNNAEEGETGGPSKPNQFPAEVESPPEWHCRERVPPDVYVTSVDEGSTKSLEKCPYVPSTHPAGPWPGKPYWLGIPDPASVWLEQIDEDDGPLDDEDAHPIWSIWTEVGPGWEQPGWDDAVHRSGLVGNFSVWLAGYVPRVHPRPPIVTASFMEYTLEGQPTLFGHPFYSGRYNSYGMPCGTYTVGYLPDWVWTPVGEAYSTAPDGDCMAFTNWAGSTEIASIYNAHSLSHTNAILGARCLDNGKVYDPAEAVSSSLLRGGLVWLNWGELDNVMRWIHNELQFAPGGSAIIIFLDWLESFGWDYWPLDPAYPYSRWSATGVCSHPATLRAYVSNAQTLLVTYRGCPTGMLAVMPDIEIPTPIQVLTASDMGEPWEAKGYCTFGFAVAPPPGVGHTSVPEITYGLEGGGFDGARYIDISSLDQTDLDAWAAALDTVTLADGVMLRSLSPMGDLLLDAFDVPSGSKLLTVNTVTLVPDESGAVGTLVDALVEVDRAFAAGEIVFAALDAPGNRRLHRYLVPHYSASVEE